MSPNRIVALATRMARRRSGTLCTPIEDGSTASVASSYNLSAARRSRETSRISSIPAAWIGCIYEAGRISTRDS
jgi:hypothetical protein